MKKLIAALLTGTLAFGALTGCGSSSTETPAQDGAAEEAILAIDPDYEPWAESILEPPGGETESLLFCLQAALGSGVLCFGFGYLAARKKYKKD